jgi:flagellar motor switch protein FliM
MKDLLSLSAGNILAIGLACDERVDILVNGTPKFRGSLCASSKNKLAVEIECPASGCE